MKAKQKKQKLSTSPQNFKLLAYSVRDFCSAVGISPRMFYTLSARGESPVITRIGRRTLITISAAEDWLSAHQEKQAA